jgi:hypothetical protein
MATFYTPIVGNGNIPYSTGATQQVAGQFNWATYGGSFDPKALVDAGNKASQSGDSKWLKTIDMVLLYGGKALSILTSTGILKNKNASNDELLQMIAAGNINRSLDSSVFNSAAEQAARSANLLGLPTSTWIIVLSGAVIYMLMRPQPAATSRSRKNY